jgi:hypothetical protein
MIVATEIRPYCDPSGIPGNPVSSNIAIELIQPRNAVIQRARTSSNRRHHWYRLPTGYQYSSIHM